MQASGGGEWNDNEVSSFGCFCLNKEKSFSVSSCEQFFRSEERIHAEKTTGKAFHKTIESSACYRIKDNVDASCFSTKRVLSKMLCELNIFSNGFMTSRVSSSWQGRNSFGMNHTKLTSVCIEILLMRSLNNVRFNLSENV